MSIDIKRYAQELLDIASQDEFDQYFRQLRKVLERALFDPELREYLDSTEYTSSDKSQKLMEVFGRELQQNVLYAFFLVNKNIGKNHTELPLLEEFLNLGYKVRGYTMGRVYSVRRLDRVTMAKLEAAISTKIGKPIRLLNKCDENLVGGVRVEVNDVVFDGSYKKKLENFRDELLEGDPGEDISKAIAGKLKNYDFQSGVDVKTPDTTGYVSVVADGIVKISGINKAMAGELLKIGESTAMVMNLEENSIGAVILGDSEEIVEGMPVEATRRIVEVPVGDALLGRVVDALGRPIDGKGNIKPATYYPIERKAPGVIQRQSVNQPLETGLKVIDSMIPIGKGQRELIIGDRQTGKTAIAVDAIINQKGKNVKCVYVAIGQKNSTVALIVERLRQEGALSYTTVICSSASELAALQYIAPYAGCAIAEYWMERGQDVLVVYDDLSKHAVAYRTLSLLLRRPPGREAYPGDVFYLHSRLLERAAKLSSAMGGGSMTALPIVETQAGDISAYIPTNVISITDGQIFLQTEMFNSGFRPAVDSGLSVSRVGSSAQSKAMKKVSSSLKLELAQYQEVLDFAQFGSDLDPVTKKTISRGQHLMAMLKQPQYSPLSMEDQVIILLSAQSGYLETVPVERVAEYEKKLLMEMHSSSPELIDRLKTEKILDKELTEKLNEAIEEITDRFRRN